MADKRMFDKALISSDNFTDMSLSAQALYFHLAINADDDGFVTNPKRLKSMIGASDDDLTRLWEKGYIIPFESGVIVITHWRRNNYLRKDRYKPSQCPERDLLRIVDGGIYSLENIGIPLVNHGYTQDRIDKDSIDDDIIISIIDDYDLKVKINTKKTQKLKKQIKNKLNEIGLQELTKYLDYIVKRINQKKFGDFMPTLDYLTGTGYTEYYQKYKNKKSGFEDFEQNDYDFEKIEQEFLAN